MNTLWDSIGERFEEMVQADFSDLVRNDRGPFMPDFCHDDFLVEAKVGFWNFGVQIKGYQVNAFRSIQDNPVVYVIGFHDFDNALSRLGNLNSTQRERVLRNQMKVTRAYFVSGSVIEGIWRKEHRVSAKEGRVYCTLKERFLSALIENDVFRRDGNIIFARRYYGVYPARDFFFQTPPPVFSRHFSYGHILHRKRDETVIDYLSQKGVLDDQKID